MSYRVDHGLRLVHAVGRGTLTDSEVFGYQREVWGRPDVSGYKELVDMTQVSTIAVPSPARVRDLAELAAGMDEPSKSSKFAIVAPSDVAFGLGRMFESYRSEMQKGTKEVAVFRTMEEALAFLEIEGPLAIPGTD
ncbi:MAG TPA: hypothetical protein VGK93_00945 [Candidatus Eisenbacteria bacterium]|jgi:hypothetical protein